MPGGTILLVEDDDDVREIVAEVLAGEGYEVAEARHGADALEVLGRLGRPCVVLLDLFMPVMNGWDFYATLMRDSKYSGMPVVVMSSAPDQAPRGVQRVLAKPLSYRDLTAAAGEFCRRSTC